jgi:hypothetical protein
MGRKKYLTDEELAIALTEKRMRYYEKTKKN